MDLGVTTVRVLPSGPDAAADREALAGLATHVSGTDPASIAVGRRCPFCRSTDHGRPWARVDGKPIGVSLARTPGAVVVAVGPDPLGVDVERPSRVLAAPLDDAFTPGEHERAGGDPASLTACWAGKEAVLKRDGRGLRVDPALVDVDVAHGSATLDGAVHPVLVRWLDADLVLAVSSDAPVVVEDHRAEDRRGEGS